MADIATVISGTVSITAFVILGLWHFCTRKGLSPAMTLVVALMLAIDTASRMAWPLARLIDALAGGNNG